MLFQITPILISILALSVSFLTFGEDEPQKSLKRRQHKIMRILATRVIILWEQIMVITAANYHKYEVDPYLLRSMQVNAQRIEEALDQAIGNGLWNEVVQSREHAVSLYVALVQSLVDASSEDSGLEAWGKQHLVMGMHRLLEVCEAYIRKI